MHEAPDHSPQLAERLVAGLRAVPRLLATLNQRRAPRLDVHELADLAQDVAVLVLRKFATDFTAGNLEGWVFRICDLELRNRLRKRRARPGTLEEWQAAAHEPPERAAEHDHVATALQRLGGYEADIIRLRIQQGLAFAAIAALLRITPASTKTRYYRGIRRLRTILHDQLPRRGVDQDTG